MSMLGTSPRLRIPEAAWGRGIGVPLANPPHPRVAMPMIDDGAWGGVPVGGLGSGSIGRTHGGDFARWHLEVGTHRFRSAAACQFSVYWERADGSRGSHVLSTLRPDELGAWNWDMPVGAGTYAALFPRAWLSYDWDALPVRLTHTQLSPVLPHNYRETSYPLGLFGWYLENTTDEPLRVGLMFTWQALDQSGASTPEGATGTGHVEGEAAGVVLRNAPGGDGSGGEFAIAATADGAGRVSFRSRFRIDDGGAELWDDFAADGALDDVDDGRPAAPGEQIGGAVAVTLELPPGEARTARFALAWDFPLMRFGSGTEWYRRYTRFFGREGGHAWQIATEGLARYEEFEAAIEAWQSPVLEDPSRPSWYSMALFNELYILVDGGTAWEDGRPGEPSPDEGDGRFAFLECVDYPFYNTYDVLFYASFATLLLWPALELRSVRSLIESMPIEDLRAVTVQATGEPAIRKEAWAAPHDLGAPQEDPWLQINAYHFQDPNRWKDLNAKFVLQVWRDAELLEEPGLVRDAWPAIVQALDRLAATDIDGDGLPDHDGRADQTFDTWPMHGPSAYAGGLWLSALSAAECMAASVGDIAAAAKYAELWRRGSVSYRKRLWTGSYLRYDGGGGPHSDSVMSGQLAGLWYADAIGLEPYLLADEAKTALRTIVERNVRGFQGGRMGAVNGTRPDGSVDTSSEQSEEVWPGVAYALAALLLHRGMDDEAWETAKGLVRTTYEGGLWFRTPEAWDAAGNFRASLYMRPLAIWAMEHALRKRG
jgi:non-lysosomal glucosylceramidase